MKWYQPDVKEVLKALQTSEEGLSKAEAQKRLEKYGPNKLPEGKEISRLKILLHQFTSPLIYILLVAAIVTAILAEYIDTGVIAAILILNAIIGYFQEHKAEASVRALKSMVVPKAKVVRGGKEKEINSEGLVPGDIVLLTSGVRVPADMRLFKTMELKVEEAALIVSAMKAGLNREEENSALQWVFRTESLLLADWVQIGLVALTVVIAVEVDKAIRRHKRRPPAGTAVAEQC